MNILPNVSAKKETEMPKSFKFRNFIVFKLRHGSEGVNALNARKSFMLKF